MPNYTPPSTKTQTSHALAIQANGQIIGTINKWAPKQNLSVGEVFEFGQVTGPYGKTFGTPYEKVPGNMGGMSISVGKYDLYEAQFERAFGSLDLTMLTNETGTPGESGILTLREVWAAPNPAQRYQVVYLGCWFSDIGRSFSTSDNRIINVDATVEYTERRVYRVQS